MIGLGKPIRACPPHVAVLNCPRRCLGVELTDVAELNAAAQSGCAVCQMPPRRARPTFRTLRKCGDHRCYSRFCVSFYDDSFVSDRLSILKRIRRLLTNHPDGSTHA